MKRETIMVRDAWVGDGNTYPASKSTSVQSLHFSSARAYVEYCETTKPHQGCGNSSKRKGSSGWCDTTSYEEAIKFANEGNPKLTAKVVAQRENMKIGLTSDTSTLTNELLPSGALPNIPIYLTGEACHMENFNVSEDKPIIRIAFCGAFNCSVKDKTIYSYGAALMNIIDEIESADIATVELTVFLAMSQEGTPTLVTVPVKMAGEEMILDDMSFFIASASNFRRLGFRIIESQANHKSARRSTDSGYGRVKHTEHIEHDDFLDSFDVVIEEIDSNPSASEIRNILFRRFRSSPHIKELLRSGEEI